MGKIIVGVIVVLAIVAFFVWRQDSKMAEPMPSEAAPQTEAMGTEENPIMTSEYKEFTMTSYYDDQGAWFSMKEIQVKKGDKVRIKVVNTKGTHDFVLDEYKIKKETPLNEEVVIEFTADKAGEFEYYCSMPGHRARGQFGKLIVTE